MRADIKRFIKANWILIWIVAACVALSAVVSYTYASYTKDNKVKRVVATVSSRGMLFSSNHLRTGEEDENTKMIYFKDSDEDSYNILICNYAQGVKGRPYERDIKYSVAFSLTNSNGGQLDEEQLSGKKVKIYKGDELAAELDGDSKSGNYGPSTLLHGAAVTDSYKVVYEGFKSELDENGSSAVFISVTATPNPTYNELTSLTGRLGIGLRRAARTVSWTGDFNDDGAASGAQSAKQPADYDAYNYLIAGSGAGEVTFYWDPEVLEVNKYFLIDTLGINEALEVSEDVTDASGKLIAKAGWKKFVITTGADADSPTRYSFQIYKVDNVKNKDLTATWDDLRSYVGFDFEAAA